MWLLDVGIVQDYCAQAGCRCIWGEQNRADTSVLEPKQLIWGYANLYDVGWRTASQDDQHCHWICVVVPIHVQGFPVSLRLAEHSVY